MGLFLILLISLVVTYSLFKWNQYSTNNMLLWSVYFLSITIAQIIFFIGATYQNDLIYIGLIWFIINIAVLRELLFRSRQFKYFRKFGYGVLGVILFLALFVTISVHNVPSLFLLFVTTMMLYYICIFARMFYAYIKTKNFVYLIYSASTLTPIIYVVIRTITFIIKQKIEYGPTYYFSAPFLFMIVFHNIMLLVAIVYELNHSLVESLKHKESILLKKNEKLNSLATIDYLTKLYNRRNMNGIIAREANRHNRYNGEVSLLIFDIDFFKNINDKYGHDIGDYVLKSLSQFISNEIRNTDTLGRWGGEEFILLFPNTTAKNAVQKAEVLRTLIEQHQFDYGIRVTCSFGVAEKLRGESYISWIKHADIALYQAKQNGRNKVVLYDYTLLKSNLSKAFIWTDDILSGVQTIDEDHKNLMMLLYELENKTITQDDISQLLKRIVTETTRHFKEEETIMQEHHFPGLKHHSRVHKELLQNASAIIGDYVSDLSTHLEPLQHAIYDLILEHLIQEDKKFFDYLKTTKKHEVDSL